MGEIRHRRRGTVISEPRNWNELEVEMDFKNGKDDYNINIARLEFAGKEALKIRERVMDGLIGGVGVTEGDPYTIEFGEIGGNTKVFEGYLDFMDDVEFKGCNEVAVSLKKKQGGEWLNDVADGFTFRYLHEIGVISKSDFIGVPYTINYIPDNMQMIVLSMSLFVLTKELINTVRLLAEAIGDTVNASTPNVGFFSIDLGDILLVAIKVVAYGIYAYALIKALKGLIEDLLEQLLPPIRKHQGIKLQTLFIKACKHLNLEFRSDLIDARKDWVVIPSKGHKGGEKPTEAVKGWKEVGIPQKDDGIDTFGDLMRVILEGFNADYRIEDGVLRLERKDYWKNRGTYVIPDFFTDQKELKDVFILNTAEVVSNYKIKWAYDTQDLNTLDNQKGRVLQAIIEPKKVQDSSLRLLKGIKEVDLPFSMGVRKEGLTRIEEVLKKLAKLADKVTGVLGGGTSFVSKIEKRKGVLLMSSHFLTVPKMVVMKGGKLARGQREILDTLKLWEELHFINSFAEYKGEFNQYKIIDSQKVPFCYEKFIELLNDYNCRTQDGGEAIIESLKWKVWENTAVIGYREKFLYTKNLKVKLIQ